jgi:endoglucanase
VASKDFFLKTLPLFDGGDDIGMVLSPQCFHNLNLHTDIFNHSNVHFWEYMQPGYDALGFISCTGTNFLVSMWHLCCSAHHPYPMHVTFRKILYVPLP